MVTVATLSAAQPLALDLCTSCQLVWFDPKEYEALPPATPEVAVGKEAAQPARPMPPKAKLTLLPGGSGGTASGAKSYTLIPDSEVLPQRWKLIPLLLGMPVEQESSELSHRPVATWALAGTIVAVSLVAFVDLETAVQRFGLIPALALRYGAATFLTSFFLHGGFFHLLANVYFLLTFGDNVEDYLGPKRYVLLLLLAALVGDLFHISLDPRSTMPSIGASGGISGIIAFYALEFPQARLVVWVRLFWLRMSALTAAGLWVLLQIIGAFVQMAGASNVSSLAHLGGAAVGVGFYFVYRKL